MDRARRARRRADCGSGEGRLVMGLFVVGLGVLFLLQNLGYLYVRNIWEVWPVFLIVMGVSRMASSYTVSGRVWGGTVAAVGGLFLAQNLGYIPYDIWHLFWPVVLILVGFGMLFRGLERRSRWGGGPWDNPPWNSPPGGPASGGPQSGGRQTGPFPPGGPSSRFTGGGGGPGPGPGGNAPWGNGWSRSTVQTNVIHEWAVFGGSKRRVESQDFQGGEALAVFGGVEVDLRDASSQRDVIYIEANSMFGGVEITVPEAWSVTVQGQGIFGGYQDETRGSLRPQDQPGKPHLIVSGSALFGGVHVKN